MTPDKRNVAVVAALVLSLTIGVVVLRAIEPQPPPWNQSVTLMALTPQRVEQVTISYVPSQAAAAELRLADDETRCVVGAVEDGPCCDPPFLPHWRVVVISGGDRLDDGAKANLLRLLASLSRASGVELVPVRLAADFDQQAAPARELRDFLALKGIIPASVERGR
jgi:hypothetical protein